MTTQYNECHACSVLVNVHVAKITIHNTSEWLYMYMYMYIVDNGMYMYMYMNLLFLYTYIL